MGYALVFPSVDGVKQAQSAVNQLIYAIILQSSKNVNHAVMLGFLLEKLIA